MRELKWGLYKRRGMISPDRTDFLVVQGRLPLVLKPFLFEMSSNSSKGCINQSDKPNYTVEYILNQAGKLCEDPECEYCAEILNKRSKDFPGSAQCEFEWLKCTRICPPKIPSK